MELREWKHFKCLLTCPLQWWHMTQEVNGRQSLTSLGNPQFQCVWLTDHPTNLKNLHGKLVACGQSMRDAIAWTMFTVYKLDLGPYQNLVYAHP